MEFIDKMYYKTDEIPRLNFDHFIKDHKKQVKIVKKIYRQGHKDIQKITQYPFAKTYMDSIYNSSLQCEDEIYDLTESDGFAMASAFVQDYQKWIALYYLNTEIGKKPEQRASMYERLVNLYDVAVFITLSHFNYDRNELLAFKNHRFFHKQDTSGINIIKYTADVITNISDLMDGLDKNDSTKVFNSYQRTCNTSINNYFKENPFPEFQ